MSTKQKATLSVGMLAAVAAIALAPTSASAQQKSGTYRLTARVPVACWVRPEQAMSSETVTGRVVEACNSPGGFVVNASYRQLQAGESARLRYADTLLDLPKTGNVTLRRSRIAQIRTVNYAFEEARLDTPVVLVLSIQPI